MSTGACRLLLVVGGLTLGVATGLQAQTPLDLGTLGGSWSSPAAVNNKQQVVGAAALPDDSDAHAFLSNNAGSMLDLGTLGGHSSYAAAITETGVIVGASTIDEDDSTWHGFVWTAMDGMIDLGTLGGWESWAMAVTPEAEVVGVADTFDDFEFLHVFRWNFETGLSDEGSLGIEVHDLDSSGTAAVIHAVHATAQRIRIVGGAVCCAGGGTAFLWTSDQGLIDLGEVDGRPALAATDVNASGQVAGVVATNSCGGVRAHGAFWTPNAGWQVTENACGLVNWADAINDAGQLVGGSEDGPARSYIFNVNTGEAQSIAAGDTAPVAIGQNGQVVGNFNGTGFGNAWVWSGAQGHGSLQPSPGDRSSSTKAYALNEQGDIVGISYTLEGTPHAVLWHVSPQ